MKAAVGLLALGLAAFSSAEQATPLHSILSRVATEFPGRAGIWVKHLTTQRSRLAARGRDISASLFRRSLPMMVRYKLLSACSQISPRSSSSKSSSD